MLRGDSENLCQGFLQDPHIEWSSPVNSYWLVIHRAIGNHLRMEPEQLLPK